MATRLERLVLLLDTGSTATVRATAAQQIGEIQKQQPHQLYNLLGRVLVHLRSAEWATRIAAGLAIEAIASNVAQWEPPAPLPSAEAHAANAADSADEWMLTFDGFDVANVVRNGAPLLASAGKEFDVDHSHLDPKERIALQKKELKTRLGMGSDHLKDLLDDDDVTGPLASEVSQPKIQQQTAEELLRNNRGSTAEDDAGMSGLSVRQKASLKRKMRLGKDKGAKVRIVEVSATKHKSAPEVKPEPVAIKIKSEQDGQEPEISNNAVVIKSTGKHEVSAMEESTEEWPFEGLCEQLCLDLFSPKWQRRHGAAIGLRGLLKMHGSGAGKLVGLSRKVNLARHRAWLEDVAIRLLCVLALDRFGDYGSDQAVAPVRETAAQTLGVVMQWGEVDLCLRMVNDGLLKLLEASGEGDGSTAATSIGRDKGWQVRHGALVGLKYWMAVRTDLLAKILKPEAPETGAFAAIINALRDHDDDVRAVSSSALLTVCDTMVKVLPVEIVYQSIVLTLWNCLEELDDLTSATGSVMDLLSQLMLKPDIVAVMKQQSGDSLPEFIPRLYPFFRHAIVGVRQAVLRTVGTFVSISRDSPSDLRWVSTQLLRLVFQNFIIEERADIVQDTLDLWKQLMRLMDVDLTKTTSSLSDRSLGVLPAWFSLVMTPVGAPLDLRFFYSPGSEHPTGRRARMDDGFNVSPHDKAMATQDLTVVSQEDVIRGRLAGATALGVLVYTLLNSQDTITTAKITELTTAYLNSCWAGHRVFCNVMIDEWAAFWEERTVMEGLPPDTERPKFVDSTPLAGILWEHMVKALTDADSGISLFYNELINPLQNVRLECSNLLAATKECGSQHEPPALPDLPSRPVPRTQTHFGDTFTVVIADHIIDQVIPHLIPPQCTGTVRKSMDDRINRTRAVIEAFKETTRKLEVQVLASMASAVVRMSRLPPKANPVIRSLMHSVKEEANDNIQARAARGVGRYIDLIIRLGKPMAISEKVLNNLKGFLCADPEIALTQPHRLTQTVGILSLNDSDAAGQEKEAKAKKPRGKAKAGTKLDSSITSAGKEIDTAAAAVGDEEREKHVVESRGAAVAFQGVCAQFAAQVFDKTPKMWTMMSDDIQRFVDQETAQAALQELSGNPDFGLSLCQSLYLLATIVPHLHKDLHPQIISLLPGVACTLKAPLAAVRNMAARCMAVMAREITVPAMHVVVDHVLILFNDANNPHHRQGAAECVLHIANGMDHTILPYIIFLIIPVLGRMSDPDEHVRFVSTNVFAQLVKLVPLESGVPDPEGFDQNLIHQRKEERKFLGQLVGTEKVEEVDIPVPIKAELRGYQKDGVSWLSFLNRYGLHGILCDDMGLGKTLQSICMLATDHHHRSVRFSRTGTAESAHVPSLIVCPPTLTGHWHQEIRMFAGFMRPIIYAGATDERARIRSVAHHHDVLITSYDILRNDIAHLKSLRFNYCILDEGHVIKNPKTKITMAVKSITAMHRLILSGTPIQNNVLELWSLFDFLMPGFLGTERQFNERFSKPIQASRDARSSSREQEKGALAMEALHKQVLPFLLRRMKEDVLHDLPPKIIQDYYCELSDLQRSLYEDFAKSQAAEGAEQILKEASDAGLDAGAKKPKKSGHVFQALQYLRKLVNHPALVINPGHPQYAKVQARLASSKSGIKDLVHAPKIQALQQLLLDCGIGAEPALGGATAVATAAPHRALIFVQLRPMLDIIENDLFKKHMPSVSYLRMDGQTDPATRMDIVRKFNEDPSIDVLLLTTHVGGLGLTLTGADTVIFVEHDWNPMKDLQAMDRAHRIGQKRVVNVYRLITKGTLEEKIMGLQKFKLNIASSVINQENSGLKSMDTDQILDLFSLGPGDGQSKKSEGPHGQKPGGASQLLAELEELSDQTQYEDLNVKEFLKGLH